MEDLPSIQQLECFAIYGRVKNFTAAAREANITQSAFSAQMKKLETTLGVQLIYRSNRGSHLTPAGENLLPKVQAWLEQMRQMVHELREEEGLAPIELNVGILRTLGDVQMNRHVSYFQQHNSRLRLNVFDMEEAQLIDAFYEERIDVASTYLLKKDSFREFETVHFCWDKMVYYAPLLIPPQGPVSLDWISGQPLCCYPHNSFMNETFEQYFEDASVFPPVAARLSTPYAMIFFCQQNRAGALLPERLLEAVGSHDGWYELVKPMRADACLIFRRDSPKLCSIRIYVEHILDCYRGQARSCHQNF